MALTVVSADLEMATDAIDFYGELFVFLIFSSIVKELLGVGVGLTGIASQ